MVVPFPLSHADPRRLGDYELIGRLGTGGQGVVFLGRPLAGGPEVAVKLLHAQMIGDAQARARFVRELALLQRVAGFCTAQMLQADMDGDQPYIVSELVPGPSLRQLVEESGPRVGADLDRLAVGTITALAAIHRAGIVHRDFKPQNVLMGPDGPRVIDFGIARALDSGSTVTSQIVGTPSYMAPEQFAGAQIGPAADLFAWAVTLLFAATGRDPFSASSLPAVLYRILNETPDLGPLPERIAEIAARCLEKEPAARPSAEEVLMWTLGGRPAGPRAGETRPESDTPAGATRRYTGPVPAENGPGRTAGAGAPYGYAAETRDYAQGGAAPSGPGYTQGPGYADDGRRTAQGHEMGGYGATAAGPGWTGGQATRDANGQGAWDAGGQGARSAEGQGAWSAGGQGARSEATSLGTGGAPHGNTPGGALRGGTPSLGTEGAPYGGTPRLGVGDAPYPGRPPTGGVAPPARKWRRGPALITGLVFAALLGALDVAAMAIQIAHPPSTDAGLFLKAAGASMVLGVVTLIGVVLGWLGSRAAVWTVMASRVARVVVWEAFTLAGLHIDRGSVLIQAVGAALVVVLLARGLTVAGRRR
ncbi:serine/threonine-protein kinase [Actinomadura macrotermitis]|uniref:Serine/threonine-protein kinase PknD n=1 Tax=Actinomadura macrotermitis TaxID=2585200 RepID=A0A7K0C826_9ACTN|nr:serine/threonine-protein kinase [Actinomadura macrotermitis]MQY09590.1 Serine/threonine-protein kinase PknD [Actinomadura macrotermitis]